MPKVEKEKTRNPLYVLGLDFLIEVFGRAVKVVELGNCIAIISVLLVDPDDASFLFPYRAWHQNTHFATLDAFILFFPAVFGSMIW